MAGKMPFTAQSVTFLAAIGSNLPASQELWASVHSKSRFISLPCRMPVKQSFGSL